MRTLVMILVVAVVALGAATAVAEPMVIAIDGDDIYVDLGARDGVGAGTELELLHEVVVRDPRTSVVLRDRFSLGTLAVVKSGDRMSVARPGPGLDKRVVVGDRVRLVSSPRRFEDPWAAQVIASKGGAPLATPEPVSPAPAGGPDHVDLMRQAWQDTLGRSPEARIERWVALLAADPTSPYRRLIENEITSLQAQIAQREAVIAKARSVATIDRDPRIAQLASDIAVSAEDRGAVIVAAPVARVIPGRPIEMSFLVRVPALIARAVLYVRPSGDPGFRRIELQRDGDANLRGTIDRGLVRGPTLEWYVEAVERRPDGDQVVPVLGTPREPRVIAVEAEVTETPIAEGRSHIDAHVDYVDFDGDLQNGFDQYYQAEIDFTYRFIEPVHAVRLGFGTLSGVGGPKDVIDADVTGQCLDETGTYRCKKLSFSYVYTEFEFRIRPNVALMVRPQAGLLTTDSNPDTTTGRCTESNLDGCEFLTGLGLRARLRLGDELGTNLVLGAGFTDGIGTLFEAAYHWRPTRVVPVQFIVQVTDQPVPESFGVRLIGDVGLRTLSWFYPSLRLSYQARDIDHAGVSGGFAMNFDW